MKVCGPGVFVLSLLVGVLCDDKYLLDAYYWRNYIGQIPPDALPVGSRSGITTYMGEVLHRELLIPAEINPRAKTVFYEWGYQAHQPKVNGRVKILCTQFPGRFKWVRTGNKIIDKLDADFVIGGFEEGSRSLIGRKQFDNDLVAGKVVNGGQSTLNVVINGTVTQHGEFDVLVYDPTLSSQENPAETKKCRKQKITIKLFN